jgi:ATP-binding cassette subfamily C (CFTR/MRP) protein 1
LTFAIFAIQSSAQGSNKLSTGQAFTSLAIISLLSAPAQALLNSIPSITTATSCFGRIQDFLLGLERIDERITAPISVDHGGDSIELRDLPSISATVPAIIMDQVCLQRTQESGMILRDISFQVMRGSLTMIIGAVGSGKSTLLEAILGELKCERGTVQVASKRMAYCRQTSWLPNTTIREIVCGDSEISEPDLDFYETVIHACALEEDIAQLPQGRETLIGSRGLTLSGGQKQRLVRDFCH